MNKIFRNIVFASLHLCVFASLMSCSSEDSPEVSYKNPSALFQPADSDNSEEAALRRAFYQKNNIYLLFNDTLQNEYLGTDINGDKQYFTETIDIGYNVGQTSASSTTYKYSYLTTLEAQQSAVDFVNNYILNHLTGSLRPYSMFLCRAMVGNNTNTGATLRPYAMSNQRCMVISMNYLMSQNRTEEQKQTYSKTVLTAVLGQLAVNNSSSFEKFFSYSSKYYSADCSNFNMTGTADECQSVGFLSTASSGTFPSQSSDLNAFVVQALQYTVEEFNSKYDGKTVLIEKFAEVKKVLAELGYKE